MQDYPAALAPPVNAHRSSCPRSRKDQNRNPAIPILHSAVASTPVCGHQRSVDKRRSRHRCDQPLAPLIHCDTELQSYRFQIWQLEIVVDPGLTRRRPPRRMHEKCATIKYTALISKRNSRRTIQIPPTRKPAFQPVAARSSANTPGINRHPRASSPQVVIRPRFARNGPLSR